MNLGWPLVLKELAQLASRERTYWFRGVSALGLLCLVAVAYGLGVAGDTIELGAGRGQFHALVAVALGLGVGLAREVSGPEARGFVGFLVGLAWAVVLVVLSARAASLFTGERTRGTLDLLLASPMSGPAIVEHLVRRLRRSMLWLGLALLVLHAVRASIIERLPHALIYLLGSLVCLGIYLPLFTWLAVAVGFVVPDRPRVVPAAIGGVLIWTVALPLGFYVGFILPLDASPALLCFVSPVVLPACLEARLEAPDTWMMIGLSSVWYMACWAVLRGWVLHGADRWLGRA